MNENNIVYCQKNCMSLTVNNNWNSNLDYGNEYVKAYFRIDTPTYDVYTYGGFVDEISAANWRKEVSDLIDSFGILEDCGYTVEHSKDKRAYLYAHPHDISGVIRKNDVGKIAEAISKMKNSSIRWVDLYDTVFDISNEEYADYLSTKKEEVRKQLFLEAATTRTNKYYNAFHIAVNIAKRVKLNRLGLKDGDSYSGGQTVDFVMGAITQMIDEGYLKFIENDSGKYIRSLNKTELRKSKLTEL